MPLWRIYSHPDTFTGADRDALAIVITDLYVRYGKIPAFYVNILFIDLDAQHTYVGGTKKASSVHIIAEQVARTVPYGTTEEHAAYRTEWMDMIHSTLQSHILDRRDLHLELHFVEIPIDSWSIHGLETAPPRIG